MKIKLNDKMRQNLLIFMCWMIYVASYISRYSYNANIVAIKDYYNVTNSTTGLVSTFFFFAYGVGQIVNGILCKTYNKKLFLSLPLIISSLINLYLFTCPKIEIYKYLWLVNGICLSVLWSLLILTLSENLDEKHLSPAMIVMSSTVAAGTIITYGCSSLFNLIASFKYSFLLGAIVAGVVGVTWFILCDALTVKDIKVKEEQQHNKNCLNFIVLVTLILFGLFMAICNLIKDGLNTWVPQILKDTYNFKDSLSIILTLVLPILGMFGAIFVVILNKVIKNDVLLNCLLFFIAGICIFGVKVLFKTDNYVMVIILFGLISLLMHAANNFITSFIPLKLRFKFNSGLLAGVLNGCGYVGSTISAYCLGLLADNGGWDSVLLLLIWLCGLAVVFSLIFALTTCRKKL